MSSQEERGDEEPVDEQGGEEDPTSDDEGAPNAERIAKVGEHIDKARSQAEEAGVLVDEHEETFADSGADASDDDQTIAPPG